MKNKNTLKLKSMLVMLLVSGLLNLTRVYAQCWDGPIMVVCHYDKGSTTPECCGGLGVPCIFSSDYGPLGDLIYNPSQGVGPSCGIGSTYTGLGDSFTGTCGWNVSGTSCGTPFGPTPESGGYDAYPCSGKCSA